MGVAVRQPALGEQRAGRLQGFDQGGVGIALLAFGSVDDLAGEERHVTQEMRPSPSTVWGTSMPLARPSSKSSAPWPGAMCTKPVPWSMVTKSAGSTGTSKS